MIGWFFRGKRLKLLAALALLGVLLYHTKEMIEMPSLKRRSSEGLPSETEADSNDETLNTDNLEHKFEELMKRARESSCENLRDPECRDRIMEYMKMLEKMHEDLEHELDEGIHEAPKAVDEKPVLPIPDDKRTSQKAYDYTRGTPSDPDVLDKRNKVKEMMNHAWQGYKQKAWTENEVRPISGKGHSAGIFGNGKTGATIVDALDTLYIMGMIDEFNEAKEWVEKSFFFNSKTDVSVFETVIRFVAGFLAAGTLSGEQVFYDKAKYVADLLEGAFNTPSGIPMAMVNPTTGRTKNWNWASKGCSILAEIGTLHLEYSELTEHFNDPSYLQKVTTVRDVLQSTPRDHDKLYPVYIHPTTKQWGQKLVSVGALGDSFYEYLLKTFAYTNKSDKTALEMYWDAYEGIEANLIKRSSSGLTYIGEYKSSRTQPVMAHLTCFAGGMIAMSAHVDPAISEEKRAHLMETAAAVTSTCHESYVRTPTHLGPESFRFDSGEDARQNRAQDSYYILRPEVVESYFYMWRYTKDQKYREWAWDAVQALEEHCRAEFGFSGIKNVNQAPSTKDDLQQSFFLAETLKYLYLIFSDDDLISLDEFVFNTEAHPLRIQKRP
ncbi:Oidioi.mRNA.OKI2018_I69.XSR.g16333.t1.cds [Oikopleura dioica]|uniref:alpha-1,2-Mannosidase n=1 Tax=Oikopleura dioica TaxID=34765 RepID=A0ABN7SM32_OIKDI|nr:Oidioi.mRNA.OKI2018_I69.XSR.g16333.t1.cds [Oikopleura dioica]